MRKRRTVAVESPVEPTVEQQKEKGAGEKELVNDTPPRIVIGGKGHPKNIASFFRANQQSALPPKVWKAKKLRRKLHKIGNRNRRKG